MVKGIPPDPGTHPLFTQSFVWGCIFPVALVFAPCPDPPVYLESSLNAGDLHRLSGCRGRGGTEGTKDFQACLLSGKLSLFFSWKKSSCGKQGKRPNSSVSTPQISDEPPLDQALLISFRHAFLTRFGPFLSTCIPSSSQALLLESV